MIINFSVKNFRSIKDEIILEFNASSDKEHPNFITETKYCNILNTTAIYGLNASGKSNLIKAMRTMVWCFYLSHKEEKFLETEMIPFAFDSVSKNAPCEFNINFIQDEVRYEYGFSADRQQIYSEWLYAYPNKKAQLLFTRELIESRYVYKFSANYKGDKKRFEEITKPTALFLSVALSFDNQTTVKQIEEWFSKNIIEYFDINNGSTHGVSESIVRITSGEVADAEIIKFLTQADFSIIDFEIKRKLGGEFAAFYDDGSDEEFDISTEHKVNDVSYKIKFSDESSGTQQMFNFAALIVLVLKNGGVLVIDELNNFLHPLLVKHIVGLFGNLETNPKRAQLIFTTHETSIMTTDFLRRDQIWFCDKSKEQSTMLYSAQEFSPRKTDNLEKAYLAGRYGAIPIFTN